MSTDEREQPIDMVLYCPNCGMQHVDAPEETDPATWTAERHGDWDNPPHRSHLCHRCGCTWRPADVPTNGVAEIKTKGNADSWPVNANEISAQRVGSVDARVAKSLEWFVMFHRKDGEDHNECFERVAEVFYKDTGYLRPGKDCRCNSEEERGEAWDEWVARHLSEARAAIDAARSKP